MRVNVYEEEITDEIKVLWLEVKGHAGKRFLGLRFYLKSASALHNTPTDDDRSAVTFWFGTKEAAERELTHALHALKQA